MPTTRQTRTVLPLPTPARVAGDVVRMILATASRQDASQRALVARSVIEVWRRNHFRGTYGAGVGGIRDGDGQWTLAAVCLACAWVGELTSDVTAAERAAVSHRC